MKKIVTVASSIILIICFIWISKIDNLESREGLLISIILSIVSVVASWAITSYFSKISLTKENTKLIDRIGEQSSEKILNQSKQLYSIEQYLDEKQDFLLEEGISQAELIYLESTRNMIRLIRSSNNTFLNDWAGVVSIEVREKMEKQRNAQSQLFEDINLIRFSSPQRRAELEEKIEKNSENLPSYLIPTSNLNANYATIIKHDVTSDTNTKKQGRITIELMQDSFKGHAVAKFKTPFETPPLKNSSCTLKTTPSEGMEINCFAKTGTVHDFHVGLKSKEFNIPLKKGIYEVEYVFES